MGGVLSQIRMVTPTMDDKNLALPIVSECHITPIVWGP